MTRFLITTSIAILGIGAVAMAKTPFVKDFASTYGVDKTTALGQAKCAACHVGKSAKVNAYGADLQVAMRKEDTKVLTGSVLKKVEGLDSDKDGKNNLEEIKAGTLPGDAKSK